MRVLLAIQNINANVSSGAKARQICQWFPHKIERFLNLVHLGCDTDLCTQQPPGLIGPQNERSEANEPQNERSEANESSCPRCACMIRSFDSDQGVYLPPASMELWLDKLLSCREDEISGPSHFLTKTKINKQRWHACKLKDSKLYQLFQNWSIDQCNTKQNSTRFFIEIEKLTLIAKAILKKN